MRLADESFPSMGTTAHVSVIGADDRLEHLLATARRRLDEMERRWSRFLPGSEVSQLNRAAGNPVVVSNETFRLVVDAIEAWRQTGGVFDPTVGSTMTSAGYDRTFAAIDAVRTRSSAEHRPAPSPVDVDVAPYARSVTLPADVQLDLGGIAKGAAADAVAEILMTDGASGCCVNIGGDLRVAGEAPRPEGWQIDLDCPGGSTNIVIGLRSGAVCTSTTLKRRWPGPHGDEHHLRHPPTGAPLRTDLVTATVVAAKAAQAEVLTKVVLAGGSAGAAEVFRRTDTTGVTVDIEGRVSSHDDLAPFVEAAPAPGAGS